MNKKKLYKLTMLEAQAEYCEKMYQCFGGLCQILNSLDVDEDFLAMNIGVAQFFDDQRKKYLEEHKELCENGDPLFPNLLNRLILDREVANDC